METGYRPFEIKNSILSLNGGRILETWVEDRNFLASWQIGYIIFDTVDYYFILLGKNDFYSIFWIIDFC